MQLIRPTMEYADSWMEAIKEFEAENRKGFWNYDGEPTDTADYIARTENEHKGIVEREDWVPSTTFWLVDKDQFVAHTNIRHELNDYLRERGGHIGYAVRPTARRQGYGTKILELAIEEARKLGITDLLVTCDASNMPSRKIIEGNGGMLQEVVPAREGEDAINKFIIH